MSCDQDDLINIMKDEQMEEDQLIDEEMPSEVVHDNITEVVDMDFAGNMTSFIDESEIEIKADDNVMEVDDDDDDDDDNGDNIIMQSSIEPGPKLTSLSGIKFVNATTGQVTNKKTITLAQAQQLGLVATSRSPNETSTTQLISSTQIQNDDLLSKKIMGKKIILSSGTLGSIKSPIKIISSNGQNIITQSTVANNSNMSGNNQVEFLVKTSTGNIKPMKQVFVRQPTSVLPQSSGKVQIVKIIPNENKDNSFIQTVENVKTEPVCTDSNLRSLQPQAQNAYKLVTIPSGTRQVIAKTASGQQILIPISGNTVTKLQPTQILQASPTPSKSNQLIMLPANFLQTQNTSTSQSTPYRIQVNNSQSTITGKKFLKIASNEVKQEFGSSILYGDSYQESDDDSLHSPNQLQSNGIKQRKPCNCTRSQCLKLYCECFANGEFCNNCNCVNCFNNLKNEEERQKAIKSCLDRNPAAFRPKIGKMRDIDENTNRKHTKGCNCKRSGCLKNYCECYEAKIFCSANCKCFGCRNSEDNTLGRKTFSALQAATEPPEIDGKPDQIRKEYSSRPLSYYISLKPSTSFITDDVIEATCHCLLAQAEDATARDTPNSVIEELIIDEFGRCLKEIIDYTSGN